MDVMTLGTLRERPRPAVKDCRNEALAIRLRCAICWLQCSERSANDNNIMRFIQLWIAFNAASAGEFNSEQNEGERFVSLVSRLVAVDSRKRLRALLFKQFPSSIGQLIGNRYVFAPPLIPHRDHYSSERCKQHVEASRKTPPGGRTADLPNLAIERLYELRNQLIHSGATWNGAIKRMKPQVSCTLLSLLMLAVLGVVMEFQIFDDDATPYPTMPDREPRAQLAAHHTKCGDTMCRP